jgi:hypothetical protein
MLPITLPSTTGSPTADARFAQAIIRRLEAPETLFVEW